MRAWKSRTAGAAALSLCVVFGPTAPTPRPSGDADRAAAREHFRRGLDALTAFDGATLFREMRASWEADPSYLPPFLEVVRYTAHAVAMKPSQRRLAEELAAGDGPLASCWRTLLAAADQRPAPRDAGASWACDAYSLLGWDHPPPSVGDRVDAAERLWRAFPESPTAALWYGQAAATAGDRARVEKLLAGLRALPPHPVRSGVAAGLHVELLHASGNDSAAAALEARTLDGLWRLGPGAVASFIAYDGHGSMRMRPDGHGAAHLDSAAARAGFLARDLAALSEPPASLAHLLHYAEWLLGLGHLVESTEVLSEVIEIAEATQDARWLAAGLIGRGRVWVKLGRRAEAERDLLAARVHSRGSSDLRLRYEVEHNLLHLYEAAGPDSLALRAGEAFVAATSVAAFTPVRMMSYRDFATFLRRRGDHDRATGLFEAMAAAIDTLGDYEFYAGEYFESIGELDRARAYYRRAHPHSQDVERALEGLVRLAELTGDTAEAIRRARLHDERVLTGHPEYRPLLPGVLARAGRDAEAAEAFASARAAAADRRQVAAWARLTLEQAAWERGRGHAGAAAALADSAHGSASRVADFETAVRARGLAAVARVEAGGAAPDFEGAMRAALTDAERARLAHLEADLSVMAAEGYRQLGDWAAAMHALERAWTLTRDIASGLGADADRAGYRATHGRISDLAMRSALEWEDESSKDRWIAWSVRRKELTRPGVASAPREAELRTHLAAGAAVIDYLVAGDHVAALVTSHDSSALVRLPTTEDALDELVRRIYAAVAPRVGSRMDLSRARLHEASVRGLYDAVFGPLEPLLDGVGRVTVVADGPLHRVPFDALAPDDGVALLHRYALDRARSLALERPSPEPAGSILVVATSEAELGTLEEVDAIAQAAGTWELRDLVGAEATEDAVRALPADVSILHFAGHAEASHLDPDFAFVALSPSAGSDGRLHAHEIRDLEWPGLDLVVLSACETAGGPLLHGEGLMSLGRAFLQAGAHGFIGSLWPIGASTSPFMAAFYDALVDEAPAEALHRAKLSLDRQGVDPLHWAAFVLIRPGVGG